MALAPAAACAHCGLPAPAPRGDEATFCCAGCATVWAALHDAGLERYYVTREATPDPAAILAADELDSAALDDADFAARYVGEDACVSLSVRGIHCASCGWVIEHLLADDDAVEGVTVSLGEERAVVRLTDDAAAAPPLGRLVRQLAKGGYSARPVRPGEDDDAGGKRAVRDEVLRLGVAAACAMNLGLFAVSLYGGDRWGMDPGLRSLFTWLSLAVATPIVAFSARPILTRAWATLRRGLIHVDVPIAVAILVMYGSSAVATIRGEGAVWFDSLGMLVLLLLGGRAIEGVVRRRANRQLRTLVEGELGSAERITETGTERVPAELLVAGDRLRLRPGDVCPVDAVATLGGSDVDLSVVDGESRPVFLAAGDELPAGARLLDGSIEAEVLRGANRSGVARTRELVDRALAQRTDGELLADRVARWFVFSVLLIAAGVGAAWWAIDASRALPVVVAVLVVACPCALALATPLAFAAALRGAAGRGLLVRNASVLLRLADVDLAAFDKTGTLTESRASAGELALTEAGEQLGPRRVLQLAAAVCAQSHHPVSRAVVRACAERFPGPLPVPEGVKETAGVGIEGLVMGRIVRVGRPGARITIDERVCADLPVAQELRVGAPEAIARLGDLDVGTALLSGDAADRASAEAGRAGIADAHGAMTPEDKAAWIRRHGDQRVLFVGDGMNDAPALAAADVGLAMGGSVEVSLAAADGVLLSQRPGTVPDAVALGRRLRRTVATNIGISVAYNALAVTAAAAGLVTPLVAATLMPISSLVVVVRASRLARPPEVR